jgi:ubiquitin-conjugating enzyme E2 O
VRAYENRMDLLRALIAGPAGTPYEGVPFLFDLQLPADYPASPPKVKESIETATP